MFTEYWFIPNSGLMLLKNKSYLTIVLRSADRASLWNVIMTEVGGKEEEGPHSFLLHSSPLVSGISLLLVIASLAFWLNWFLPYTSSFSLSASPPTYARSSKYYNNLRKCYRLNCCVAYIYYIIILCNEKHDAHLFDTNLPSNPLHWMMT